MVFTIEGCICLRVQRPRDRAFVHLQRIRAGWWEQTRRPQLVIRKNRNFCVLMKVLKDMYGAEW